MYKQISQTIKELNELIFSRGHSIEQVENTSSKDNPFYYADIDKVLGFSYRYIKFKKDNDKLKELLFKNENDFIMKMDGYLLEIISEVLQRNNIEKIRIYNITDNGYLNDFNEYKWDEDDKKYRISMSKKKGAIYNWIRGRIYNV